MISEERLADRQRIREGLGYEPDVSETVEDIDPDQWLSHDDADVCGHVITRAGRLRIAALTEKESQELRRKCERDRVPGRPSAGRQINLGRLRSEMVAASLNKAYGWTGTPNELTGKKIEVHDKLAGEVSLICQVISEVSGFKSEDIADADNFLSVR